MPIIRVVSYADPPWATECFPNYPNACEDPGVEIFILHQQLVMLGFNIEYQLVSDQSLMFEALKNNSADISGTTYPLSTILNQSEFLAPSLPLTEDKTIFVARQPSQFGFGPDLLLDYCTLSLWLLLLSSLGLVLLYQTFHRYVEIKLQRSCSKLAPKFPLLIWGFVLTVVLSCYSQFMAIAFTIKLSPALSFTNLESLSDNIKTGLCKLVIRENSLEEFDEAYLSDYIESHDEFMNSVKFAGYESFPNESDWVDAIKKSDCNVGLIYKSDKSIYRSKYRGLVYIEDPTMPPFPYVYFYRNNYTYKKLLSLMNTVMGEDVYKTYMKKASNINYYRNLFQKKITDADSDSNTKPLTINQVVTCFYLLTGGAAAGIITYSARVLTAIFQRKRSFEYNFSSITSATVGSDNKTLAKL